MSDTSVLEQEQEYVTKTEFDGALAGIEQRFGELETKLDDAVKKPTDVVNKAKDDVIRRVDDAESTLQTATNNVLTALPNIRQCSNRTHRQHWTSPGTSPGLLH